jgi:hypothetical protein
MWRYDTQFFVTGSFNADNQIAMGAIADHLATKPRKSLRRP